MKQTLLRRLLLIALLLGIAVCAAADERRESFDRNPGWDGWNHFATEPAPRTIRQDFGYSPTSHAGGKAGEIGGFIQPASETAYYAKKIPTKTLADSLSASGTLACTSRKFHLLVGFFNANTVKEWRTPNSLVLRLYGRGDVFYAYVEYATQRWRAGGDSPGGFAVIPDPKTGKRRLKGFATGGVAHTWSLKYDPQGHNGDGTITVTLDDETAVCNLNAGHRQDGATFNRFGLLPVLKSADDGGEVWLDDVTVNGVTEHFDTDPKWDAYQNRRTYQTEGVRPRFHFGYSPTHYAKGKAAGELGGLIFRGDGATRAKMAYYGDRLDTLTLAKPLHAAGKVCFRWGVSDSTTLFGFFHSRDSLASVGVREFMTPPNFVGIAIEGPSREGFLFYPTYNVNGQEPHISRSSHLPPYIYPDGAAHTWALDYTPPAAGQAGKITVTLDRESFTQELSADWQAGSAHFDRFGIITTGVDGNGQRVYFDDLRYTCRQE